MTDKIQQARRAAFESQMEALNKSPGEWRGNHYSNPYGNSAWQGFNAALDCVVIELPTCSASMFVTSREAIAAQAGVVMCSDAIESTNLWIKAK